MSLIRFSRSAATIVLVLLVPYASAQAPSGSGPLPYSTSIGSEIDHVDLATGTLNVTIPFVSVPGKHMRFDFGLSYNPGFWSQMERPDQTMGWILPPANRLLIKGTNIVGWRGMQGFVTWSNGPAYCVDNDGNEANVGQNASIFYTSGGTQDNDFAFTDRGGTSHNFLVNYFNSGECDRDSPSGQFNSSNFEGPSPDMEGFYATLGVSGSSINIYGPDGTQYTGTVSSQTVASGGYSYAGSMFSDRVAEIDSAGNTQAVASGFADSLGRTPVTQVVSGNQILYTIHDANGTAQVYTVNFANQALTSPDNSGIATADNQAGSGVDQLITSIQPPQGPAYQFQYDASGALTQLTLPSGAVIHYKWQQVAGDPSGFKVVTQRSVSHDGVTDVWDVDRSHPGTGIAVLNPADSTGQRYMSVYNFDQFFHTVRVQYLTGSTQQSAPVLQYDIAWDTLRQPANVNETSNALMTSLTTTLENGMVSKKTFDYDLYSYPQQMLNCGDKGSVFFQCLNLSNGHTAINNVPFVPNDITYLPPPTPFPGSHGNVTGIHEYDWGNGAPGLLVRQTIRKYLHDQNPNYFSYGAAIPGVRGRLIRNIVNRVVDETIYDGSAVCTGAATWVGDGSGNITPAPDCTATKVAETKTTYDNGNPDTYGYKGLATSVENWAGDTTYISTSTTYDPNGNPLSVVDPLGHTTTYGYADAFSSAGSCGIPAGSNGYVTSVTNAAQEQTTQVYNACTGSVASSTNANGATASFAYDWKGRRTSITNPDGGITTTAYDDIARVITTDQQMNSSQVREIITQMDMLGHAVQTRLTTDPAGALIANTTYDAFGRVVSTTNPFHSSTEPTYGVTAQTYDARGRKSTQTNPDHTTAAWSYTGNVTMMTDENGHAHSQTNDALGRLTNVVEPGGLSTDYSYDLLSNLTYVNQHGLSADAPRARSFGYDPLSRLRQSNNPETGAISYIYDADGNLFTKTDARNVTTTYTYDTVNRLINKTYSGSSNSTAIAANTPPVTFTYGATSGPASLVGRLTTETTGPVNAPVTLRSILSYDPMGRVLSDQQVLNGGTPHTFHYTYDFAGNITSSDNGVSNMGIGLTSAYDGAGQLQQVSSTWDDTTHPGKLFSTPTGYPQTPQYGPAGLLNVAVGVFSNSAQELYQQQRSYDNRMRVSAETDVLVNSIQRSGSSAAAGTGTITISGDEGSTQDCEGSGRYAHCTTTADSGVLLFSLTANGSTYSANAPYQANSTDATVATALASAISRSGAPVTASASNGIVTITSTTTGAATNYAFSIDSESDESSPDFYGSDSGNTLMGGVDATVITTPAGTVEYSYSIPSGGYDARGNITAVSDSVMGHWTYGYDNLDRLISAQAGANPNTSFAPYGAGLLQWSYDSFGNFKGQSFTGNTSAMVTQGSYSFSASNNHIDNYSYDAAGNLLQNGAVFTYDAEGRVATMNGQTSYIYDAEGRRVAKMSGSTVQNQYLLGLGGEQVSEVDGQNRWLHTNAYAGGRLLGTYDPNGVHFHFTDWLGTRRVQMSAIGSLEQSCVSLPFGDGLNCVGADVTEQHFTGKERDTESGLDYFGARYYGSSMGRWTSPDPLNLTDERLLNPQTLNKYGYAANNPLKYIDPDGKDITYFYDPGGTAGHAVLFAYNQATGDSALESFGPNIHAPLGLGESNFDMNLFSSAQGLRDNYVSLTIQTNPELTQEVISYIRSNPDPSVWSMTGPNCSTQCGKILQKFKLDYQKSLVNRNLTPKFLFKNLMSRYNPGQSTSNPKQGHDYGAPRADMYQLLWNHINPDNFSVTTSQQDSKNGVPIAPCGGDNPCNK